MASRLERGDVRQYRFPGSGKRRPVLVLTRSPSIRNLSKVTVAPLTSTIRNVPSEVILDIEDGMKKRCAANLHHLVTVQQKELGRRLAQLSPRRMQQVCSAVLFALGCEKSGRSFENRVLLQ